MLEQEETQKSASDIEKLKQNELTNDAQGISEYVEEGCIAAKKKMKLWHKILIIGATTILLILAAVTLLGGLFKNNESDDPTEVPSANVTTNANDENEKNGETDDNDDFVTPVIQYEFLDYTEFSTYWFDGVFRCGTDFTAGDYYILPLFGAGAMYEVADTPDDFSWTYYRLLRKIHITEGEYVNVAHGAIMVPADEIDVNDWTKYGVFLVGKDISAGEYKMETLTDKYQSNLYGITGISGAYQLNDSNIDEDPVDSNYLFDYQKYITLEDGQYIIITNVKLTNVNVPFSDTITSNDQEDSDNTDATDTSSPNNDPKESFISNGHFTFSARSFVKLFDEADKEAKGYNYTYMRMNGETSLFYELAEISGGYEKVRSAGMISFVKGVDTTLSIEEDYTENIITKINVLVEDLDDVPPILVGCMCAADPALDFTTAYNLGMDVVETAGTEDGYVHNGIKYVIAADGEYYYIIISLASSDGKNETVADETKETEQTEQTKPDENKKPEINQTTCEHKWSKNDYGNAYCSICSKEYEPNISLSASNLPYSSEFANFTLSSITIKNTEASVENGEIVIYVEAYLNCTGDEYETEHLDYNVYNSAGELVDSGFVSPMVGLSEETIIVSFPDNDSYTIVFN